MSIVVLVTMKPQLYNSSGVEANTFVLHPPPLFFLVSFLLLFLSLFMKYINNTEYYIEIVLRLLLLLPLVSHFTDMTFYYYCVSLL